MFQALCVHHQEVKIVLYSIWYRDTLWWPSGAQVERGPVHGTATTSVMISGAVYSQTSVHEPNSFLKVVRKPKLFSAWELM